MVFTSLKFFAHCKGPDEFWRKRKIFKLAALFQRRNQNCYSLTIRAVNKALMFASRGRKLKRMQLDILWEQRLEAACHQHEINFKTLKEGLVRSDILLDRKSLVNLAIWEPRSFKSIATIACARATADGYYRAKHLAFPTNVIARGLYK